MQVGREVRLTSRRRIWVVPVKQGHSIGRLTVALLHEPPDQRVDLGRPAGHCSQPAGRVAKSLIPWLTAGLDPAYQTVCFLSRGDNSCASLHPGC